MFPLRQKRPAPSGDSAVVTFVVDSKEEDPYRGQVAKNCWPCLELRRNDKVVITISDDEDEEEVAEQKLLIDRKQTRATPCPVGTVSTGDDCIIILDEEVSDIKDTEARETITAPDETTSVNSDPASVSRPTSPARFSEVIEILDEESDQDDDDVQILYQVIPSTKTATRKRRRPVDDDLDEEDESDRESKKPRSTIEPTPPGYELTAWGFFKWVGFPDERKEASLPSKPVRQRQPPNWRQERETGADGEVWSWSMDPTFAFGRQTTTHPICDFGIPIGGTEEEAIGPDNVGYQLLQYLGWKEGESLGKRKDGMVVPMMAVKVAAGDRRGLESGNGIRGPFRVDQKSKRQMGPGSAHWGWRIEEQRRRALGLESDPRENGFDGKVWNWDD